MQPHISTECLSDTDLYAINEVSKMISKDEVVTDEELKEISKDLTTDIDLFSSPFRENSIECPPLRIRSLQCLTILVISHNNLSGLPSPIVNLSNLISLDMSNNLLTEIPPGICELRNLKFLKVAGNAIKCLPDLMSNLTQLDELDISKNEIDDFPESLAYLEKLRTLNSSSNKLSDIPHCFYMGLKDVAHLDLSQNKIDLLSTPPLCAHKLKTLDLSDNLLSEIPEWMFASCGSLVELNLSQNKQMAGTVDDYESLCFIGEGMRNTLQHINISGCKHSSKSVVFLSSFKNLVEIRAGNTHLLKRNRIGLSHPVDEDYGNIFWDMPITCLRHSSYLTELYLPSVGMSSLPDNISELKLLAVLDLSSNELSYLNDEFCQLKMLSKVFLSYNHLETLPRQFGELDALTELYLDGNRISSLPESFCLLKYLRYLDMYDNCMEQLIPDEILLSPFLQGLDLEENIYTTDNMICCDRYNELKMILRSQDGRGADRGDGSKPKNEEYYDDVGTDSCESSCSRSYHSESGSLVDDNESQVQISAEDSNWDSPIEDETDWIPPDIAYYNTKCRVSKFLYPRSILTKRTYTKPNVVIYEGQFDNKD